MSRCRPAQAALLLQNAMLLSALRADKEKLSAELKDQRLGEIIGACPSMLEVFRKLQKVAGTDINVLITGENGTGKGVVAQALHAVSPKNCAVAPEHVQRSNRLQMSGIRRCVDRDQGVLLVRSAVAVPPDRRCQAPRREDDRKRQQGVLALLQRLVDREEHLRARTTGRHAVERAGAHEPLDDHGALLREVVGARERLVPDRLLGHHALDEAAPVADRQEMNLPARSAVVQPSADGDGLSLVAGDVFDVGDHLSFVSRQEPAARTSQSTR